VLDIDRETGEVLEGKEKEAENKGPKKRLRRNVIQFNGENIKTCGIDGIHLTAIKNAEARGYVKVVDEYLKSVGANDLTFLRKEEGKELVEILSKAIAEEPPAVDETEQTTEWEKESNARVPCPLRGGIEVDYAFCEQHCPKYADSTCEHFFEQ